MDIDFIVQLPGMKIKPQEDLVMRMACLLVHVWVKSKQPPTCTSSVIDLHVAFLSWAVQSQI